MWPEEGESLGAATVSVVEWVTLTLLVITLAWTITSFFLNKQSQQAQETARNQRTDHQIDNERRKWQRLHFLERFVQAMTYVASDDLKEKDAGLDLLHTLVIDDEVTPTDREAARRMVTRLVGGGPQ